MVQICPSIVTLGKVFLFVILPLTDINVIDKIIERLSKYRDPGKGSRSLAPKTPKLIIRLDEHLSKAVSI